MSTSNMTPIGAVGRGIVAGVAGTAVMTGWQELSARLQGSGGEAEDADGEAEGEEPEDPWEQASAPAKVARRMIEGVFQRELPAESIPILTHGTHWGYGTVWGVVYGLFQGTRRRTPLRTGLAFGTGVWLMSYVQLVPMGLYQPPWEYPPKELAMDLSYHLAYGAGLGAGWAAVDRG